MSYSDDDINEAKLPQYSLPDDLLPSYTPTLSYSGVSLIKTEFISPYHIKNSRSWVPVYLELNSTQLNIYKLNDKNLSKLVLLLFKESNGLTRLMNHMKQETAFSPDDESAELYHELFKSKLKKCNTRKLSKMLKSDYSMVKDNLCLFEPEASEKKFAYKGDLLHSYTLANLSLGEAPSLNHLISAMYKEENTRYNIVNLVKYKNILRLRIEYSQILIQFWSFPAMLNWYRFLVMGKDLSSPLDHRQVSKLKSIPTRYSRRNIELLAATAASAYYNNVIDPMRRYEELMTRPVGGRRSDESEGNEDEANNLTDSSNQSHSEKESDEESIFTDRRPSVSSAVSSIDDFSETSLLGYKFHSREHQLSVAEKQYISNCIPDLNSYDKWCGKVLTISNYQEVLSNVSADNKIFVNYTSLPKLINRYKNGGNTGSCRQFLIHQSGLVSLPSVT